MNEHLRSSLNLLRLVRMETDSIGVALSFGKDSMCTLDICSRFFKRVEAYYLFRVRSLATVRKWAKQVQSRYDVKTWMYPHFDLSRCYRNAVLQPHWKGLKEAPKITMTDIEAKFRKDADVDWIAYGWRRSDSLSRALIMKQCGGYDEKAKRVFPLRVWKRGDVYAYLASREISAPEALGRREQGGLDFHAGALRYLKETNSEDWERWLTDFPFSEIQLLRDADQE